MNFIEIEKYFILFFGLGLFVIEALLYFKYTRQPRKILYMGIGAFWTLFMLYSIIAISPASELNQIIGISGTLFSIAVLFGNSLNNYRRIK